MGCMSGISFPFLSPWLLAHDTVSATTERVPDWRGEESVGFLEVWGNCLLLLRCLTRPGAGVFGGSSLCRLTTTSVLVNGKN